MEIFPKRKEGRYAVKRDMNNKVIVILGPTASGKSELAINLARKFRGEIVSADSRQVYRGLDIGSGKITKKEMRSIPHYLLDVANPKRKFSVYQFQKLARKKIKEIQKKGKIPFLVGGTGFYIQSVVDGILIPSVAPNWKLRKELARKSISELFLMLKKIDPRRARSIDTKNPRRLIRAIEIVKSTGNPIPTQYRNLKAFKIWHSVDVLQIGIKKSTEELKRLIYKRLQKRIKGIIAEVKKLHQHDLSWKRLEELGLEYRFTAQYLQQKITYQEMINSIQKESEHFAKRQMTWFKRDKRIHWIKKPKEVKNLIDKLLQ